MKTRWILCFLLASAAMPSVLARAQGANSQGAAAAPIPTPLVYRNTQYGFCFLLPVDWKGYTIVAEQWSGTVFSSGKTVTGPQLAIRHPAWTQEKPYQDIPIMVFTPAEWQQVAAVTMSVSAAPIGPEKLGDNGKYVFALPPRWIGFDDARGQDEVNSCMQLNRLQAPCGTTAPLPTKNLP